MMADLQIPDSDVQAVNKGFRLYEVNNSYTGESYIRCYVWAENEQVALLMAQAAYLRRYPNPKSEGMSAWENLQIRRLFSADDPAFCTIPDDSGWETEKIKH